jgi:UDP:flavonoid glycosyltransferase YjiC (YdhE family)
MSAGRVVLYLTSNGTGFGHLTRSIATGRRLEDGLEPVIFTLSAAAPVVRRLGIRVEYLSSYRTPGAGSEWSWHRRLRARLEALIAELGPAVLVFDGVHPYVSLLEVLHSHPELPAVWCRRGMWRPGAGREFLASESAFDLVLEPGELAASDDAGLTAARRESALVVDPVVLLDPAELLPRADAERELGLEPGRVNALVAIGAGSDAVDRTVQRCLDRLARQPGVQPVALESSISRSLSVGDDVVRVRDTYPMSRYLNAFDLTVSAAGYNNFHELHHLGVPALFVPMPRELDDQAARARWAQNAGTAVACAGPDSPELEAALDVLLDPARRTEVARRAAELGSANGAPAAAEAISRLAASAQGSAAARRQGWRYRPVFYAWMLARHPAHRVFGFGYRAPRAVVVATGASPEALRGLCERLPDELGQSPERILVVTDADDLGPLRRAGFGVEYVPPGADVERRLELILADRDPGTVQR